MLRRCLLTGQPAGLLRAFGTTGTRSSGLRTSIGRVSGYDYRSQRRPFCRHFLLMASRLSVAAFAVRTMPSSFAEVTIGASEYYANKNELQEEMPSSL